MLPWFARLLQAGSAELLVGDPVTHAGVASAGAIYFNNGHLLLLEHVEFEANTASDAAAPQALYSNPVGSGSAIISHCTFFNHSSPLVDYARTTIHCVSLLFHPGTTLQLYAVCFLRLVSAPVLLGSPLGSGCLYPALSQET